MELSGHADPALAWREVRSQLRKALGESMYAVWIDPVKLDSTRGTTLFLKAPPGTKTGLRKRYGRTIERTVRSVLGETARISFDDKDEAVQTATPIEAAFTSLNPRYRFDQFIIGDGNRLAHAAALAVAELPGQAYNPLFLHAPPGLGKTHLLHAIGNYLLEFGGGARVRYTTVESFTNDFLTALARKSIDAFKQAYRDVDALLIDDVQFLANKAKTEEEFFHTFNAIQDAGRQVVLTCDVIPSRLAGITERLRERFEAGLVANIQPPDLPTRVAILRKRALLDDVDSIGDDVLELIASRVSDNVRTLEGALIRVVAHHSLTQQPLDVNLAETVLREIGCDEVPASEGAAPSRKRTPASLETVKEAVAAHYGLSHDELISSSRAARVGWPRQVAIHLARELTGSPLTAIGAAFGDRNHATVMHACRRVAQRAAEDPQLVVEIEEVRERVCTELGDRPC